MGLVRFGVSIDGDLLERFDRLIAERRYENRSEAIRDLLREKLADVRLTEGQEQAVGAVMIVYDHHRRDVLKRITDLEHDCSHLIRSSVHVHLSHHDCLEVIVVAGQVREIGRFSDSLIGIKGVRHGKVSLTIAD
jgi:CopG family nickel-responsive transcriptional regulator